jgi:hypothetical protein
MAEPTNTEILAAVQGLKTHFDARLKEEVTRLELKMDAGFGIVNARLDEQRQTINAMIPTHLAAVPPARQAS